MQRLTKEYPLNINEFIDMKYGSVDKNRPCVIYIEGKSWVTPKCKGTYKDAISEIVTNFKDNFKAAIHSTDDFYNKFLFDFDIKSNLLKENKKSFMSFELLIKQNGDVLTLNDIKTKVEMLLGGTTNNLVEDFNKHIFILEKRK